MYTSVYQTTKVNLQIADQYKPVRRRDTLLKRQLPFPVDCRATNFVVLSGIPRSFRMSSGNKLEENSSSASILFWNYETKLLVFWTIFYVIKLWLGGDLFSNWTGTTALTSCQVLFFTIHIIKIIQITVLLTFTQISGFFFYKWMSSAQYGRLQIT